MGPARDDADRLLLGPHTVVARCQRAGEARGAVTWRHRRDRRLRPTRPTRPMRRQGLRLRSRRGASAAAPQARYGRKARTGRLRTPGSRAPRAPRRGARLWRRRQARRVPDAVVGGERPAVDVAGGPAVDQAPEHDVPEAVCDAADERAAQEEAEGQPDGGSARAVPWTATAVSPVAASALTSIRLIGRLADHIGMSKSGLYAHFGPRKSSSSPPSRPRRRSSCAR